MTVPSVDDRSSYMRAEDPALDAVGVGTVSRVVFFVATIVLAVVVVVATKGSFHRLGRLHFRMLWLLFLGLGDPDRARVRRLPGGPHRRRRLRDPAAVATSLIFAFCFVNRTRAAG